jgi:hypothetical protein
MPRVEIKKNKSIGTDYKIKIKIMKTLKYIPAIILIITAVFSCKKNVVESKPLAALNLVNTITGGTAAKFGSYNPSVSNNANAVFGLNPVNPPLIYVYPVADSLHPYYNNGYNIGALYDGDIYTLFLGGTPVAIDAILVKEAISYRTDSTAGIRFVNLSPNSQAVNVTLSTSSTVNEFGNVAYKGITDFKSYSALSTNTSYIFQVRSASTPNTVLASITLSGVALTTGVPSVSKLYTCF